MVLGQDLGGDAADLLRHIHQPRLSLRHPHLERLAIAHRLVLDEESTIADGGDQLFAQAFGDFGFVMPAALVLLAAFALAKQRLIQNM